MHWTDNYYNTHPLNTEGVNPGQKIEDGSSYPLRPTKRSVGRPSYHVRVGVAESVFGEIFATGSRINVRTEHAQTLSSQSQRKRCRQGEVILPL